MTAPPVPVLARLPMKTFVAQYWAPEPGQHVAMVGPNGCGKTTLGLQLLASATTQHPKLRGVALVMKPHKGPKSQGRGATGDRTVASWNRTLGAKTIRTWPPPPLTYMQKKPSYYALWPPHSGNPGEDDSAHAAIFGKCIIDSYKKGDSIVFCDEAAGLKEDLDLEPEMKQTLSRGRSMDAAMYLASQRPAFVPKAMFTEAKHYFMWRMSDEGEYERLREIGAGRLNRKEMVEIIGGLREFQCLYMYPSKNIAAILT